MPIDFVHMNGDSFEDMCAALLSTEYGAVPIEANPGDGGIDSFRGSLSDGVDHIWQCKHFPDGIGKSQKANIRESLQAAVKNYHPKKWTLVVSCNMDEGARRWFEKQHKEFAQGGTELDYLGETELGNLLRRNKTIRQDYFPTTDNQMRVVTALLGGKDELLARPESSVLNFMGDGAEYINDAFPDWDIKYGWDGGVQTVEASLVNPNAKDAAAATFEFHLPKGAAGKKVIERWDDMNKKGTPFVIDGKHVVMRDFVFDRLLGKDGSLSQLQIVPHVADRRLPIRLIFTAPSGATARLPFVDLRLKRSGTEEALLTNEAQEDCLLIVRLTANASGGGFTFNTRDYVGRRPSEVARCEDTLALIAEGNIRLDMELLETDAHIGAATLTDIDGFGDATFPMRPFYRSLTTIEEHLDPSLRVPKSYYDRDVPAAARLAKILTDGELKAQGSAKLTLTVSNAAGARESIANNEPATLLLDESTEEVKLLGKTYVFDTITSVTAPLVLLDKTPDDLVDGSAFAVRQEGDITRKYTNGRLAPEISE